MEPLAPPPPPAPLPPPACCPACRHSGGGSGEKCSVTAGTAIHPAAARQCVNASAFQRACRAKPRSRSVARERFQRQYFAVSCRQTSVIRVLSPQLAAPRAPPHRMGSRSEVASAFQRRVAEAEAVAVRRLAHESTAASATSTLSPARASGRPGILKNGGGDGVGGGSGGGERGRGAASPGRSRRGGVDDIIGGGGGGGSGASASARGGSSSKFSIQIPLTSQLSREPGSRSRGAGATSPRRWDRGGDGDSLRAAEGGGGGGGGYRMPPEGSHGLLTQHNASPGSEASRQRHARRNGPAGNVAPVSPPDRTGAPGFDSDADPSPPRWWDGSLQGRQLTPILQTASSSRTKTAAAAAPALRVETNGGCGQVYIARHIIHHLIFYWCSSGHPPYVHRCAPSHQPHSLPVLATPSTTL